jgi:ATP-dependent Clp protease, protease subunit
MRKIKEIEQTKTVECKFIPIFGEITDESSRDIVLSLLKEKKKVIILTINSPGGSISAGNAIIDAIMWCDVPVYTLVIGTAYSMAFNISIVGDKRFCTPLSTFMLHDTQYDFGSYSHPIDINDVVKFQQSIDSDLNKMILDRTKITKEELLISLESRRDIYFNSASALKKKIIDNIVKDEFELMKYLI